MDEGPQPLGGSATALTPGLTTIDGKKSQIEGQFTIMGSSFIRLENIINDLEKRLKPVLSSVPPNPSEGADKADSPTLVPLAQCIANGNKTIEKLIKKVSDISKSLEV